jgi:hypothetical protein
VGIERRSGRSLHPAHERLHTPRKIPAVRTIGGVISSLPLPDNGWVNARRIEASDGMFI